MVKRLDRDKIAKEIYFACQELPTDKVDPTLMECYILADKVIAFIKAANQST
jgi:hypothetical protein